MRRLTNILLFVLVLGATNLFALDKESVFAKLKKEYGELNSIHIVFSMGGDSYGELYAARGGKMQLSLKDNIIISDGKTIWNLNPNNSVAISNYEESIELTLENIFFEAIKDLAPVSYSSVSKTNTKDKYKLYLKPKKNSKFGNRLNSLVVYFDGQNQLSRLLIDTPNGASEYTINQIEINPKIEPSRFTYTPQKGVEVIDFR